MLEQQILDKIKRKADVIAADLGVTITKTEDTEAMVQRSPNNINSKKKENKMTQNNKNTENGTIVSNSVIRDSELSAKASGLYTRLTYLLATNEGITFEDITKCGSDGEVSIRSGLKELKEKKLLLVYQPRSTGGFNKNVYILNPTESQLNAYTKGGK